MGSRHGLPKVIFRRSWLYDSALMRDEKFKVSPPGKRMEDSFKKIEREWKKSGPRILRGISRITGLSWHEKEIVAYLTWGVKPYSDPLTINPRSDIHTLTHELIHRIVSEPENWKKIRKHWMTFMGNYRKEAQVTKTHIVIHAIHALVMKKLFNNHTLSKEKKSVKSPMYIRSWELADEFGYENVVAEALTGKRHGK